MQISFFVSGQILKNNLPIWTHWSAVSSSNLAWIFSIISCKNKRSRRPSSYPFAFASITPKRKITVFKRKCRTMASSETQPLSKTSPIQCFLNGPFPASFFVFSIQFTVNNVQCKFRQWLDSNRGPLVSEATALKTWTITHWPFNVPVTSTRQSGVWIPVVYGRTYVICLKRLCHKYVSEYIFVWVCPYIPEILCSVWLKMLQNIMDCFTS